MIDVIPFQGKVPSPRITPAKPVASTTKEKMIEMIVTGDMEQEQALSHTPVTSATWGSNMPGK